MTSKAAKLFKPGDRVILFYYGTTQPSLYGVVIRKLTDGGYEVRVTLDPDPEPAGGFGYRDRLVTWKSEYIGRNLGEELLDDAVV